LERPSTSLSGNLSHLSPREIPKTLAKRKSARRKLQYKNKEQLMDVGFIDHHLANYHADVFFKLLTQLGEATGLRVTTAYEVEPRGDVDWCAAHGVQRATSPEEVVEKVDAVMVLAPDNFEVHRALALPAVRSGKPVFIDKFLAPTLGEARDIVEEAEKHSTPLMSSSALRFAVEVEELLRHHTTGAVESVFARGMGNWGGYGVHTVAMILRVMGGGALRRVCDTGVPGAHLVTLDFATCRGFVEVREAENQYEALPWQLGVRRSGRYAVATVQAFDAFYENLIRAVMMFFATRTSPVTKEEMLNTVAILEGAARSLEKDGAWVNVEM
jgi:predicted dehydrogenase